MKLQNIHLDEVRNIYVSPRVDFNAQTGICEISGESFLEETPKFYAPLVEWIEQYIKTGKPITFNIKLSYFNTSSSKWLLRILYILSEIPIQSPMSKLTGISQGRHRSGGRHRRFYGRRGYSKSISCSMKTNK